MNFEDNSEALDVGYVSRYEKWEHMNDEDVKFDD